MDRPIGGQRGVSNGNHAIVAGRQDSNRVLAAGGCHHHVTIHRTVSFQIDRARPAGIARPCPRGDYVGLRQGPCAGVNGDTTTAATTAVVRAAAPTGRDKTAARHRAGINPDPAATAPATVVPAGRRLAVGDNTAVQSDGPGRDPDQTATVTAGRPAVATAAAANLVWIQSVAVHGGHRPAIITAVTAITAAAITGTAASGGIPVRPTGAAVAALIGAKITTACYVNHGRSIDKQSINRQIHHIFLGSCCPPLAQQAAFAEGQSVRADSSGHQGGTINQHFTADREAVKAGQTSFAKNADLSEGVDAAERQATVRGRGQITFGRIDTQTGGVVVNNREITVLRHIRGKTQTLQGARLPTGPQSCQGIGCDIKHHTTSYGAEWSRTFTTVHRTVIHNQMIGIKGC